MYYINIDIVYMLYNQIRSSNMNQHHAGERLNLFIQSLEISKKEFTRMERMILVSILAAKSITPTLNYL